MSMQKETERNIFCKHLNYDNFYAIIYTNGQINTQVGENMKHEMKLQHSPFLSIKAGTKTVEMRLYDEKRALIRVGDEILFTDVDTAETLDCIVVALYVYKSFDELYRHHDKISIGYKENETADPKDMLAYYPQEKIEKYGVIGIGIRKS